MISCFALSPLPVAGEGIFWRKAYGETRLTQKKSADKSNTDSATEEFIDNRMHPMLYYKDKIEVCNALMRISMW